MRRTMRYTDVRGRRQTLTAEQAVYLHCAQRGYDRGWGGLSSTLTVRLLHERGLIVLDDRRSPWRVLCRTPLGDSVLDTWNN